MFDMFKMLGKLNDVKASLGEVKEELKKTHIEATDSKGMVTVYATCDKSIHQIVIKDEFIAAENKTALEQAIVEATQNVLQMASEKSKATIEKTIKEKYPEVAGMGIDKWLS